MLSWPAVGEREGERNKKKEVALHIPGLLPFFSPPRFITSFFYNVP